MPKHSEKKIIKYTALQMFDLVADIDSYHLFLPWCNNSRIVKKTKSDADIEHLIADLEIGYKNLVYIYRSDVSLDRKNLSININFIHGPFKHLKSSWNFSIYNLYNRENPYALYFREISNTDLEKFPEAQVGNTAAFQTTLFKIIPAITWNFEF